MGFTLRYILGLVLVLHFSFAGSISTWERYVREAVLTEAPRSSSAKAVTQNDSSVSQTNATNAILSVEPLKEESKPKTEKVNVNKVYNRNDIFTTESNRLRSKIDTDSFVNDDDRLEHEKEKSEKDSDDDHYSSDSTYDFPSRSDSGRSIDFEINKFTPEYKKKNDVYGRSLSPDDKFATHDFDEKFTYKEPDFSYFESTTEYKIPHYSFFDHDHDDDFHKSDDEIPDSKEKSAFGDEPDFSESKDTTSFDINLDRDRTKDDNDTKMDMDFLKRDRFDDKFEPSPKKDKNSTRKNVVTEKRTSINYNSSFNKTEILGDKKERPEVDIDDDEFVFPKSRHGDYESTTHKNIIYSSVVKKNNVSSKVVSLDDDDEDDDDFKKTPPSVVRIIDATTHRTIIFHPTTRKNTILTKPPALNNSHVPLLNNKIESETIKNIVTTTARDATTRKPIRKETIQTVRVPTTRRSTTPRIISAVFASSTNRASTQPADTTQEASTTFRSTTVTQPSSSAKPSTVVNLETTVGTTSATGAVVSSSAGTTTSLPSKTDTSVSSSTVAGVVPVTSTTAGDAVSAPTNDTRILSSTARITVPSFTKDAIGVSTTERLVSSSASAEPNPSTATAGTTTTTTTTSTTTKRITTTTTTDAATTTTTKEPSVSTTVPSGKAQTKGEKEIPSFVPTRNTLIHISKRGSVKFNSPTTEITRIRSTATPRNIDTTTIRFATKPYRSSIRGRPTTTTESQEAEINPMNPNREVVEVVSSTETGSITEKRELNSSLDSLPSAVNTEQSIVSSTSQETTEKERVTTSEHPKTQITTSTTRVQEISPDSTTRKIESTTIPQSSTSRRRLTSRNFIPKIITPRYATATTPTTTTTTIRTSTTTPTTTTTTPTTTKEEEEQEQETETAKVNDYSPGTKNATKASSVVTPGEAVEDHSHQSDIDRSLSPVTDKDMNYTISDDIETSSNYNSEIETVMNNSFVVTSSTTEEYSYEVTGVTEDTPETSTSSSKATENTNMVPKVTEKTTTVNDEYDEDDGVEEDDKLPNQTDETEHSTQGPESKSFDDGDNKEEEDRTENDEYTESPYYSEPDGGIETTTNLELQPQKEGNGGTIAAIVISCVGAICLIILAALLILVRKRQKRFNYGQRCTPVSLDAYSMDNVSVYNSVRRKGIMRASKRSYGNPAFEDPDSISHPLNFPALAKFATNLEDIRAEFEEIPQVTARMSELPEGCDVKNRYANVIPLPETRVFLTPIDGVPNSDYINANYVTGPKDTKGYYIACQGPLQNTIEDFWRMVWEQQSKLILMITHLFENGTEKCADYMPPSEITDCHRLFGDFQITLKKREVKDKYIISSLQLKNMVSNSWREVTHFWYLGWPEKGVPLEANSLIAFLIEARSYVKNPIGDSGAKNKSSNRNGQNPEISPIVVHCSPGTGRTGTVIACDIAIREFELSRLVDIPKIVYKIRRDRASSVQTRDQYAFIYKVISVYATKLTGGSFDSL